MREQASKKYGSKHARTHHQEMSRDERMAVRHKKSRAERLDRMAERVERQGHSVWL